MQSEFPEVYSAMLGPDGQVDHVRVKAAVHQLHGSREQHYGSMKAMCAALYAAQKKRKSREGEEEEESKKRGRYAAAESHKRAREEDGDEPPAKRIEYGVRGL